MHAEKTDHPGHQKSQERHAPFGPDRLRLPLGEDGGCSRDRHRPGGRQSGYGGAGPSGYGLGDHGRDDPPHQGGGARRRTGPGGHRHALWLLQQLDSGGDQQCHPHPQGGPRRRGQARGRRFHGRDGCGHRQGRYSGAGPYRPDSADRHQSRRFQGPGQERPGGSAADRGCQGPGGGRLLLHRSRGDSRTAGRTHHQGGSPFPPSASAPAPAATARCW